MNESRKGLGAEQVGVVSEEEGEEEKVALGAEDLGEKISNICCAENFVDTKLSLPNPIPNPVKSHVNGFGFFGAYVSVR